MAAPPPKSKKPLSCDPCKSGHVVCFRSTVDEVCLRCQQHTLPCITTPVRRGRPPKYKSAASRSSPASSGDSPPSDGSPPQPQHWVSPVTRLIQQIYLESQDSPPLTPELVADLFDCFDRLPPLGVHPIISVAQMRETIRSPVIAFHLDRLSPEQHVLALCMIACASRVSFHEAILGPGPRPRGFGDIAFFRGRHEDVRSCGARRQRACRALHAVALRAAWAMAIPLRVTIENAASCYLLDLLEEAQFPGWARPWGTAYMSHLRALAGLWVNSGLVEKFDMEWAGALAIESVTCARRDMPNTINPEDQLLLCGYEPPSLEDLFASSSGWSADRDSVTQLMVDMSKYLWYHTSTIFRAIWESITGYHVRHKPLNEPALDSIVSQLSLMYLIIERVQTLVEIHVAAVPPPNAPYIFGDANPDSYLRRGIHNLVICIASLSLTIWSALRGRDQTNASFEQTREIATTSVPRLVSTIRWMPLVHLVPLQLNFLHHYARVLLEQREAGLLKEREEYFLGELATLSQHLAMSSYSQDVAAVFTDAGQLMDRMDHLIKQGARA
ncbi:Zn(2)-C6 fungal-type domain-containing protein [Mycena kentingensis (nom. inval.)]|nr:Zn(2)-C6 fungal-type domain-containing protein [Mycena kentingensis (nom. inval.)]